MLYTIKEFCEMFKVTPSCFHKWVNQGKVKVIKLGKLTRITEEEIERLKKGDNYEVHSND